VRRSVWTIVVAGGSGSRFGRLKQFDLLVDRPVVAWSVDAARAVSDGVVLVLPAAQAAARAGDPGLSFGADAVVAGGESRSASVRRGMAAVPDHAEVIVVHDAARPLASRALFEAVIAPLLAADHRPEPAAPDGVICGVPVADTLKRVGQDRSVLATVDRAELVAVQTPQAFRAAALRRAHAAGGEATDDAALIEQAGGVVLVVPGEARNVKVTTPADLVYLAHLVSEGV
jgi:2-C-methyl-D-erythritol 4-phosphate cytidylyltransferase